MCYILYISLKKSLAKLSDEEEDDDDYRIGSESSDDELVTSDSQEKKVCYHNATLSLITCRV